MILYPAIDLKGGQCVRLFKGDMNQATVFNDSPAAQAKSFEDQGFEYLHVVDLNGAPVTGLDVKVDFNRPATEQGEISAALTERAPGVYRLAARPWSGAWDMHAIASKPDGRSLEIESRLQWP